ncbi:hypothetical protein ACP3V3_19780 [Vibrio sp. PNB22_3_1]
MAEKYDEVIIDMKAKTAMQAKYSNKSVEHPFCNSAGQLSVALNSPSNRQTRKETQLN